MLYMPNTLGGKTIIMSYPGLAHELLHSGIYALSSGIRWIKAEIPLFHALLQEGPDQYSRNREIKGYRPLQLAEV
jgi:hypothetical protein